MPAADAAAADAAAADDDDDDDDDEPAAAAASSSKSKKKKVDPLALTLEAEAKRQKGGGGAGAGSSSAAAEGVKIKRIAPDKLAQMYYTSSGSAVSATIRGGGGTSGDFLSEHGMIEHRVEALRSGKFVLEVCPPVGKGKSACRTLAATFKTVRRDVCEHVQLLTREELKEFVAAIASRGSSRRGNSSSHLLNPAAMAARSPAVLWSFAHEFHGDIARGVAELLG